MKYTDLLYGTAVIKCSNCGGRMMPVTFLDEEEKFNVITKSYQQTGRVRTAVDYLECECCLHKEPVDDSLDEPWRERH